MARHRLSRCSPFVALFLWNKHRQSGLNELVIGISPPFAKPLQAAADEAKETRFKCKTC